MPTPDFSSPADLPTPFGYSHVVGIPAGRLVWTSGQVALDPRQALAIKELCP